MKKLTGESMNITEENLKAMQQLFPEAFEEGKIDFDVLRQLLGDFVDDEQERYSFKWNGKGKALRLSQTPSMGTLRPCKEESKDWDNTENLYIEGDNLEVLKLLQKSYYGKVKMIYIDPPYNTGGDFVYKDNFHDNIQNYKEITGQVDGEGNKIDTNTESNGRFHTDWLNMMYPRLRLARNLLTDDGVIFISIDDNEQENLKRICDEVFGENNFVNVISVKMSEPTGVKMAHVEKKLPKLKEYIMMFKKGEVCLNNIQIPKDKWDDEYKTFLHGVTRDEIDFLQKVKNNEERTDNDVKKVDDILKKVTYESLISVYRSQKIETEEERLKFNLNNSWRIIQTVSMSGGAKILADEKRKQSNQVFYNIVTPKGKMYIIKGDYSMDIEKPRIKILFANEYLTVHPCDFWQDIKTTGLDNEGFVDFRNGKKPLRLLRRLIDLICDKNSIVLDFFSGSGTTAQAVIESNFDDMANRKFILVQLPEDLDKSISITNDNESKKSLKKAIVFLDEIGRKHTLCEIGKERIRRAGEKIKAEAGDKAADLDIGFKVFKLDSSNLQKWNPQPDDLVMTLQQATDNFLPDRTEQDVLYEIMLKMGLELTCQIEEEQAAGETVYIIGGGALMICLGRNITTAVAEAVVKLHEEYESELWQVVFRDTGFASDMDKTNVKETLKAAGLDEDSFVCV